MSSAARKHFNVNVELPTELEKYAPRPKEALSTALRLLWLVDLVRRRELGISRGARLSGLPLAEFMRVLAEHGVPTLDVDEADLADDLEVLGKLRDAS